jgi:hypothetical protein
MFSVTFFFLYFSDFWVSNKNSGSGSGLGKKAWIRIQIQRIYNRNTGEKSKPYPALLIQEVEDAQLGLDEVNAGLVVVEVDHLPLDPLLQHKQHVNN